MTDQPRRNTIGSFNQTCALSNLNITPECPVKLLFLTRNPYAESKPGCYHDDQWFVRTPPISGKYADYGEAEFQKGSLAKLIATLFDKDVVERPFGFNKYHQHPVLKGKGIGSYMEAAWQGRLQVQDGDYKPKEPPESFPTWHRVFEVLKAAKLPLQHEKKNLKGYNAQPVAFGIVCVTFNEYGNTDKQLKAAHKVLARRWSVRRVRKWQDRKDLTESCLLVTVKGGFDYPDLVRDVETVEKNLTEHPEHANYPRPRPLPVAMVMARADVWDHYCKIKADGWNGPIATIAERIISIQKAYESEKKRREEWEKFRKGNTSIPEHFPDLTLRNDCGIRSIPFQTGLAEHLAASMGKPIDQQEDLIRGCAEAVRVGHVMERLHQSWQIPALGGQDGEWELHEAMSRRIHALCKKELAAEKAEAE